MDNIQMGMVKASGAGVSKEGTLPRKYLGRRMA